MSQQSLMEGTAQLEGSFVMEKSQMENLLDLELVTMKLTMQNLKMILPLSAMGLTIVHSMSPQFPYHLTVMD